MSSATLLSLQRDLAAVADTLGPVTTLTAVRLLLLVAASGDRGLDRAGLPRQLGMSEPSITRTLNTLSDVGARERPDRQETRREGRHLVEVTYDPADLRCRRVRITPAGKALVEKLVAKLESRTANPSAARTLSQPILNA